MNGVGWWKWIRIGNAGRAAVRRYWYLNELLGELHEQLETTEDAELRSRILRRMSTAQAEQARIHDKAFGYDDPRDDAEFMELYRAAGNAYPILDMAASMLWSARLFQLLADVERAVRYPRLGRRLFVSAEIGIRADDLLSDMAALPVLGDRMALLPELHRAVCPVVGVQAAEVVRCLPYPDGRVIPAEKS